MQGLSVTLTWLLVTLQQPCWEHWLTNAAQWGTLVGDHLQARPKAYVCLVTQVDWTWTGLRAVKEGLSLPPGSLPMLQTGLTM